MIDYIRQHFDARAGLSLGAITLINMVLLEYEPDYEGLTIFGAQIGLLYFGVYWWKSPIRD